MSASPDLSTGLTIQPFLPPQADLFARRAARLRQLTATHPLSDGLSRLAQLCDAQQSALNAGTDNADGLHALMHGLLQLAPDTIPGLTAATLPDGPALEERVERNLAWLRGDSVPHPRDATDLLVCAALQTEYLARALRFQAPAPATQVQIDLCPCCGSAALASVILTGHGKDGLRYLECALCASRWHAVRARCTLCDNDKGMEYLGIEGDKGLVQAEACPHCHAYLKHFIEARDPDLDLLADDIASLALDVLVGEKGYMRAAPNPFLLPPGEE